MPDSNTIRLLIVDDHKVVRHGLKTFLSLYDDIELVAEAGNGEQAVEKCAAHQPDVVLMDLVMPVMDGPTAIRHIHTQFPRIGIVALTSFGDETLVHRAIEAGAVGFLYKDVEEEELIGAIRAASQGQSVLASEAMQALTRAASPAKPSTIEPLTKREQEILSLVALGKTNPQIAEQLTISPSTVHFHVHNILSKLQAQTRTEAVTIAIQNKLIKT